MITNRRLLTTDCCLLATSRRAGFTLIEMLVVVIIIIVLATIAVAITPRIAGEQKVAKGADQVQGWLLIAKSRAKRDQIPTGVRLIPSSTNPADPECWRVRELQYIQQPDDFVGGQVSVDVNTDPRVVVGTNILFTGGFTDPSIYPVQPGDYIEFMGGGAVHLIAGVNAARNQLTLVSPISHSILPTSQYRILRKPRVLIGETPMLLAQDVIIDRNPNTKYQNDLPGVAGNPIDLMFSPSGSLMNSCGGNKSFLALWLRDVTADGPAGAPEMGGDPIVVCVYKRAGFIAAHPVDKTPPNPYTFATDGKSSGL